MGNQLAVSGSVQELHLQDLAEGLVQDHPLGGGRLLKSVQCWTEEGMPVVVKVYLKREDDPPLALAPHHAKLKILNEKLSLRNQPNVLSYNRMVETDKAGYLVRQYCYSNLADRISTRPFFSAIGKRWIAFQILQGLSQIHKLGLYHGDLKADNVILTAWDWVFLTDLAPFKPSRIPDDDPSFFSYYFDTSGRRICLLAPERFCPTSQVSGIGASASATPLASTKSLANAFVMIDNNGLDQSMVINEDTLSPPSGSNQSSSESNSNNTSSNNTEEITEKMDIFSAGCVIAQLFLDGEALFDYSQLLAYRKGDTEHFSKLMERVEDKDVREMITHMLDLDPNKRLSAEEYITKYTPTIFPIYFKYIHEKVMIQMLDKNCDKRIQTIAEMYNSIIDELSEHSEISKSPSSQIVSSTMIKTGQKSSDTLNAQNATEYTGYIQKNSLPELISDTKKFNHNSDDAENKEKAPSSNNKIEKLSERRKFNNGKKLGKSQTTHEGIEIIATLLCSSVRNAQSVSVRVQGLDLMKKLADFSSNYTKLERLIPYTCALLNDQAPLVKSKAIDTLTYILTKITAFPPSDSNLFNDYILPALKIICTDKSDLVRVTFAENLPLLAYQARRFLEMSQIINQNINNQVMIKGTYDSELNSLQDEIGSRVLELSMDQCTVVKRSLLKNITPLCIFYGRRKTNDFVLPMVITFLNSRQWRLRHAFFEQIVGISIFVGPTSLKEFILPCIMQALYDVQEFVIDQALNGLVALCELGMFEKSTIVDIAKKVSYLLYHPNTWIRYNAIAFFSAASKQLGMADTSCFLLDILKPHLAQSIMIITEYSLLESVNQPIVRDTFDRAIKALMEDFSASSRQPFRTLITQKLPQATNEEVDKLEVILPYLSQVATAILSKSWENNNDGENQSSNDSGGVVQLNLPLFTHFTPIESPYISLQSSIAQNNQAPSKPSQSKQYNNEWNTFFSMSGKPKSKTKDNDEFPKNITNPLLKASTIGKWRPNGNLFGQSTEHKGSINEISVHDSLYWFVTGGNDGTVRLWDLTNTERDFAMNSKMTYTIIQGGGRVNSVAILNVSSPLIAACTDKGWIHVFSADLGTTMYTITISDSGAIFVQSSTGSKTQEASINVVRPLNIGNQPLLVCGNQNGMVVGIDPRAAREAFSWKSKEALEQGPISEICCGDNEPWVISSTKRGFLTLWDLRYQISVSNTRINDSAINRISICKNSVLTSSFSSPSVYIASQNNDINLWNLETQQTLFRFRCSDTRKKSQSTPYTTPNLEQPYGSSDKFAIGEIKKIMKDRKQFSTEEPTFDINALYVNDYDGCFYSGSSDGIVRFWDVNKIDQSYVVSGASQQAFVYGAKKEDNCTVFTEDVMSLQRTDQSLTSSTTSNRGKGGTFSQPIATHHLDTITDIEVVSGVSKGHFQPLLLTASRDGMLKVWK